MRTGMTSEPSACPTRAAAPTLALKAPDIARYAAGNTGIPYATTFESVRPGPHVMLVAVTHGNELCGAIALDRLLRDGIRPQCGRLTLCFANHAAYGRFDPSQPALSRFVDEDLNRLWSPALLDSGRESVELRRARALRPLVEAADLLLDIHSMQMTSPPLMLAGPLPKGRMLAQNVGVPQAIVCDAGHVAGPRLRDYGPFADPESPRNALLVECGQHWESASAEVALETAARFLLRAGIVETAALTSYLRHEPTSQRVIEVTEAITVRSGNFCFTRRFAGLEVVPHAGTLVGHDGDLLVRTPYDDCVLVMPSPRSHPGQTAVRLGRYIA